MHHFNNLIPGKAIAPDFSSANYWGHLALVLYRPEEAFPVAQRPSVETLEGNCRGTSKTLSYS